MICRVSGICWSISWRDVCLGTICCRISRRQKWLLRNGRCRCLCLYYARVFQVMIISFRIIWQILRICGHAGVRGRARLHLAAEVAQRPLWRQRICEQQGAGLGGTAQVLTTLIDNFLNNIDSVYYKTIVHLQSNFILVAFSGSICEAVVFDSVGLGIDFITIGE